MPKNQFTQANFEESVRQRWLFSNPKVAIGLIDWNRKVNVEIEKKQKQEQKELEQQKLREEALRRREQEKAISESASFEPSPTKETGAVPKRKSKRDEEKHQQYLKEKEKKQLRKKLLKQKEEANSSSASSEQSPIKEAGAIIRKKEKMVKQEEKGSPIKKEKVDLEYESSCSKIINKAHDNVVFGMSIFIAVTNKMQIYKYKNSKLYDMILNYYTKVYIFSKIMKNLVDKATKDDEKRIQDQFFFYKQALYTNYTPIINKLSSIFNILCKKEISKQIDNLTPKFQNIAKIMSNITGISTFPDMSDNDVVKIKDYFVKNVLGKTESKDVEKAIDPMNIFDGSYAVEEVLQKLGLCLFRDEINLTAYRTVETIFKVGIIGKYLKIRGAVQNISKEASFKIRKEASFKIRKDIECAISRYFTFLIFEKLLEKDYITTSSKESHMFVISKHRESPINQELEIIKEEFRREYGFTIPQDLCFNVPGIKNIEKICYDLASEYSECLFELRKVIEGLKSLNLAVEIENVTHQRGILQKERGKADQLVNSMLCEVLKGKLYQQNRGKLEKVLEQNGYMAKINEIVEKLIAEHQALPNKKVEEVSSEAIGIISQKLSN